MTVLENLAKYDLELPSATTPGGSYVSVNIRENIAYLAIQFPIVNNKYFYQGRLGKELSTEKGYKAMELCAMNVLAQINEKVGFERLVGLNHLDVYYQASSNWNEGPKVVDGASNLFLKILEEKGTHSRAIFGVQQSPSNFSVGLTASFTIKEVI